MMKFLIIGLLALHVAVVHASLTGHVVLKIESPTADQREIIAEVMNEHNMDVWKMPRQEGDDIHVHLSPSEREVILPILTSHHIHHEVLIEDLQSIVDEQALERSSRQRPHTIRQTSDFDLDSYHTVNEINNYLSLVANECPTCRLSNLGNSYEGRATYGIRVGNGQTSVVIDGTLHAREWISPATVLHLISKLAINPNNDPIATALTNEYTFYMVPMVNPDGYEYSIYSDRMQRKTRSPNSGSSCVGTDLNRNFGHVWGGAGASTNKCSETYRGTSAFSEIESQNLRDYILTVPTSNNAFYLTFHSYGDYLLYPWGWGNCGDAPSDQATLEHYGRFFVNAISRYNFILGQSGCIFYEAAGGSDDWAKSIGLPLSYTIELTEIYRNRYYNFLLPEAAIPEVEAEIWNGVKAILGY